VSDGQAEVAVACLVVAFFAVRWRRANDAAPRGVIKGLVGGLIASNRIVALVAVAAGSTLLVHAASLGLLEAGVALGSFDWAEVTLTAFWGAVAAASLTTTRRWPQAALYGAGWAVLGIGKLVAYDALELSSTQVGISALALAGTLLSAAVLGKRPLAIAAPPVAAAVAPGGALSLGGSSTSEGLWVLAAAAPFALVTAARFRERLLSTSLWASALVLGLLASALLVEHTALVAVWAAAAAALAALAELTRERRLHLAAYAFSGLALAYTLYELAPPEELFVKQTAPADGVLALLLGIAALVAVTCRVYAAPARDELDRSLAEFQREARPYAVWAAGLVGVYAASLGPPRARPGDRPGRRHCLPARAYGDQHHVGRARPDRALPRTQAQRSTASPGRVRDLRRQPGQDLPLRPQPAGLGDAGALVPRRRRRAAARRVLLPAAQRSR